MPAGRLEVTGSDTRASCGMYSPKCQTRTPACKFRPYRIKDEYQARIHWHLIAYDSEGVPQISGSQNRHPILPLWTLIPSLLPRWDVVLANKSVLQDPGYTCTRGPGRHNSRHNWFEPSTQGVHAADSRLSPRIFSAADIEPTICEPRA
jgi:hypothetical protein